MKNERKSHSSAFLEAYQNWLSFEAKFILDRVADGHYKEWEPGYLEGRPKEWDGSDYLDALINLVVLHMHNEAPILPKDKTLWDLELRVAQLAITGEYKKLLNLPEIEGLVMCFRPEVLEG